MQNEKQFSKGDLIIRQGDTNDRFLYLVTSGSLAVKRSVTDTVIDCGILRQGDIFGEVSMILGTARAATIMGRDDGTVLQMDKGSFLDAIREDPSIAWKVLTKLALRTEMLDELQDQLSDAKMLRKFLLGK
jgi:CRP-like cAMP-binding protein